MEKYKTLKRSYEGFDTLIDPVKKSIHLQVRVFVVLFIIHFMAFCCLTYLFFDAYTIRASIQWLLCKVLCEFFPLTPMSYLASDGNTIIFTAQQIYENPQMEQFAKYYLYQILIVYVFCCAIYTLYPFLLMWLRNRAQNLSNKQHVSGANLVTAKQYKKMLNKKKDQTNIPCGKVKMPVSAEPKHCLMLGVNDSARKIFIAQLIEHLKKNNEKAIIYDSGGTFSKQFYQQDTDFIFNPVDKNTLGWSLINEISEKDAEMDMDAITSCLLAELRSDNKEAVKSVFAGIFAACIHRKRMANTDIYQLVSSDFPSISNALKGIETAKKGYRHIAEPSDRYAKGIFAIVTQYSKCFEFMTYNDGPFSMKQWLHQPGGIIFVTTDLNAHDKLSPVLTLFLDLISQRLLSLDQPLSHPVYYIFDDFVSLKKKNYLLRMLLASGSKGGRVFLGCQDFDQIDTVYGREMRQLMVNNCGNHLFFRVINPVSAKISSDLIGETEFFETGRTLTGTSSSMHKKREPLVFATDLMNMPLNEAVVRFSGYDPLITSFA